MFLQMWLYMISQLLARTQIECVCPWHLLSHLRHKNNQRMVFANHPAPPRQQDTRAPNRSSRSQPTRTLRYSNLRAMHHQQRRNVHSGTGAGCARSRQLLSSGAAAEQGQLSSSSWTRIARENSSRTAGSACAASRLGNTFQSVYATTQRRYRQYAADSLLCEWSHSTNSAMPTKQAADGMADVPEGGLTYLWRGWWTNASGGGGVPTTASKVLMESAPAERGLR